MINIKGFIIYENENELNAAGIKAKPLSNEIQVGDYWLTNNGYYVPVIKRIDLNDTTNCKSIRITSPNIAPFRILTNRETGRSTYGVLRNFNRTAEKQQKRNLMLQDRYFIELLEGGMDIFEASKAAYHKANQPLKLLLSKIHKLMEQDVFKEVIRSAKFMDNLSDNLKSEGVDKTWIAKQLKSIVEDTKQPHQIRQFALDNIIKSVKDSEAPKSLTAAISKSKQIADEQDRIARTVLGN